MTALLPHRADPPGREGDADGTAFLLAQGASLLRLARGLLADPAQAEDVVVTACVVVARDERSADLRPHLRAVRRRLVQECLRRSRVPRRARRTRSSGSAPAGDDLVGVVRRLEPLQRAVLVLRLYLQLDDAEVADLLDVDERRVAAIAVDALAAVDHAARA